MLKSSVSKVIKTIEHSLWGVLALMPMVVLADNPGLGPKIPFGDGAGVPDVATMLSNLISNFPALLAMVTGMAYLFGFGIMLKAVWTLKQYGLGVSMTAQQDIRPILMRLAAGAALIFIPSTLKSLLVTVYGADVSPIDYQPYLDPTNNVWMLASKTLIVFTGFIGVVAIIRGLLHMHKAAEGQSQQNGFAKGIIHLLGGVLSMNIIQTKNILYSTLGLMT